MGRLGKFAAISLVAATWGASAYASDSIKLIDSSELLAPANAVEPWATLNSDPASLADSVTGVEQAPSVRLTPLEITDEGVRLGMEIRLDESDQVELRDSDRIYLEADFGASGDLPGLTGDLSFAFGNGVMTERGLNSVSLLSRASSLALEAPHAAILLSDPRAVTPQYAGVRVGFATSDRAVLRPSDRGLDISVSSMVMVAAPDNGGLSYLDTIGLAGYDRAFNVGLNVGYRGFTIAASFLRGTGPAFSGYESYDFGLSYDFGSWATSVAVGGYFADRGALSILGASEFDRLYSVEIGASYRIRPGIKVLGRLRLFDYQTLLGAGLHGQGGSLYLGTSLGF